MRKKLVCILLTLVMILSCSLTSFGAYDINSAPLTLGKTKLALNVGDIETLTPSVMGCIMSDAVWSSSNEKVATVKGGTIKAVGMGRSEIKATTPDGLSAICHVHVSTKGIDVSSWQGNISWSDVKKSGVDFAIIRTGYGSESWDKQTDPYFEANYNGAKANGIKVGVYHFSYATTIDAAAEEAKMCLSILNGRSLDYPVYIDIEDSSQRALSTELLSNIAATFCRIIETSGYKAGIYSSPNVYNSNLSSPILDPFEKWVAHWGVDVARYSKPYGVWQFGSGSIPGISGAVDLNYSYNDYSSNGNPINVPEIPDKPDTPEIPSNIYIKSDTIVPYSFGTNNVYYYKITTNSSSTPTAVSSNPSAVKVSFSKKLSDGYLFKITNVNSGTALITTKVESASTIFTAYGKANGQTDNPVPKIPSNIHIKSDTIAPYSFSSNNVYYYKITTNSNSTPTAVSSNPNAVKVSFSKKLSDGYLFKITNVNKGTALITTKVESASTSFTAYGKANGQTNNPVPEIPSTIHIKSDTIAPYSFGTNNVYYYKITTNSNSTPTAVSSNPSAVKVSFSKKLSDGYLFKITNVNKGTALITTKVESASTPFTAYGKSNGIISDTTLPFTIKRGNTYQFKFTLNGTTSKPIFTTGNNNVLKTASINKIGNNYYYKILSVGKGCTGIYTTLPNQKPVRHCIVTV